MRIFGFEITQEEFKAFLKAKIKTKILIIVIVIVVISFYFFIQFDTSLFGSKESTTTDQSTKYAPQTVGDNSSGNIQVQGGDVKIGTQLPEPEFSYKIILNELEDDGLYHITLKTVTVFEGFQRKSKLRTTASDLKCTPTALNVGDYGGVTFKREEIFLCASTKPIIDNGNLFSMIYE